MNRWVWVVQYGIVCFLALVLAAILRSSHLFQATTLGARGLAASDVVRFLGDATALLLIWLAAARAASSLPDDGSWKSLLRHTLTPVATLIGLALGYGVLLFLLRPFLNHVAMMVYGWLFVVAIVGAAVWLALTAYRSAGVLGPAITRLAEHFPASGWGRPERQGGPGQPETTTAVTPLRCRECGTTLPPGGTFCQRCGRHLAA